MTAYIIFTADTWRAIAIVSLLALAAAVIIGGCIDSWRSHVLSRDAATIAADPGQKPERRAAALREVRRLQFIADREAAWQDDINRFRNQPHKNCGGDETTESPGPAGI